MYMYMYVYIYIYMHMYIYIYIYIYIYNLPLIITPPHPPREEALAGQERLVGGRRLSSGSFYRSRCPLVGRYAPLGFQKSLKPRNTLYTLPSEPQPDR